MTRVSHVLIAGDDMRLGTLTLTATLSAALLSGCSFIGGQPGTYKNPFAKQKSAQHGQYGANRHTQGQQGYGAQRCQISSPNQPIPRGCRPEQVTLSVGPAHGQLRGPQGGRAGYGGFPQEPNYGSPDYSQPEYTSGAYGSAVGQTAALAHHTSRSSKRKPKLRGALSLGLERSVSGDLIDYDRFSIDAVGAYNPQLYNEGTQVGSDATGDEVRTTYTANDLPGNLSNLIRPSVFANRPTEGAYFVDGEYEAISRPNVSFDDAWATPAGIKGGLEYMVGGRTTVFANAGYTHSEGNDGVSASVDATLYRVTQAGTYDYIPAVAAQPFIAGTPGTPEIPALVNPLTGELITPGVPATAGTNDTPAVAAVPEQYIRTDTISSASFVPNQEIAQFIYDFSDMRRIDLEAGARHYFKPIVKSEGYRTVTPFVGASAGASHHQKVDVKVTQRQRFYERGFDLNGAQATDTDSQQFYDITDPATTVTIFEDQWVPAGQVNVGAEWQVTPKTALAFETGVRVQGGRKYSNGERSDTDISIPVTLRGSFNF